MAWCNRYKRLWWKNGGRSTHALRCNAIITQIGRGNKFAPTSKSPYENESNALDFFQWSALAVHEASCEATHEAAFGYEASLITDNISFAPILKAYMNISLVLLVGRTRRMTQRYRLSRLLFWVFVKRYVFIDCYIKQFEILTQWSGCGIIIPRSERKR